MWDLSGVGINAVAVLAVTWEHTTQLSQSVTILKGLGLQTNRLISADFRMTTERPGITDNESQLNTSNSHKGENFCLSSLVCTSTNIIYAPKRSFSPPFLWYRIPFFLPFPPSLTVHHSCFDIPSTSCCLFNVISCVPLSLFL